MHQQLWGYKVEWKSVSRGTGGKKLNTTALQCSDYTALRSRGERGNTIQLTEIVVYIHTYLTEILIRNTSTLHVNDSRGQSCIKLFPQ
jgi:hypothetical protein